MPRKNLGHSKFLERSKSIHGDRYEYISEYVAAKKPVIIRCSIHGDFSQMPDNHMAGHGCRKCAGKERRNLEWLYEIATHMHGRCLSKQFNTIHDKYLWKCHRGHKWHATAGNVSRGKWCPTCKSSSYERVVEKAIKQFYINDSQYCKQYSFTDCIYKRYLKFDFYIPMANVCIEVDGIQHFKALDFFGGESEYNLTVARDKIKNEYCKANGIKLIRLHYKDCKSIDSVFKILKSQMDMRKQNTMSLKIIYSKTL